MKKPMIKIFVWIAIFMMIISIGCSLSSGTPTSAPQPASTAVVQSTIPQATIQVAPSATPNPLPSPTAITPNGDCTNPDYPVANGATWSYASSGGNKGSYTYTRTIQTISDKGFTTADAYSTGVNWVAKWTCQNGNLAALDAGPESAAMSTSKVKLTSSSVTANGYNIPATFNQGSTWSEEVTVDGTVEEISSGKTVTSQIIADLNCAATGADSITVPAGKFDTVTAKCTKKVVVSALVQGKTTVLGSNQETITFWYAQGVGLVKSVATGGQNNETIVLTRYQIQ
jgi:hypothetical protein